MKLPSTLSHREHSSFGGSDARLSCRLPAMGAGRRCTFAYNGIGPRRHSRRAAHVPKPARSLDILVVAKAAPVDSLSPFRPLGWVYDICLNPHNGANDCPPKLSSANLYGGTRLQLWQGDTLKIHLVNKLPPITDADHAKEPGEAFLALNPTNLHTHGMLVSPHYPSPANPTWGDNVFVLTFNSANGNPAISPHLHATVEFDATDYEIKIPKHHPSGLFWFHPHAHGIALNQVSAG